MASVIYDPLVHSISRRLGNFVYTTWKGKNVIRSYPQRKRTFNDKQRAAQDVFRKVSVMWKELPKQLKDIWRELAKDQPMTGMNMFMRTNMALVKEGKECMQTPA
jgi:hypothetical protein